MTLSKVINMLFHCALCGLKKTTFYKSCCHLKLFHEHEASFVITCHFENCQHSFRSMRCYRRHVSKKHHLSESTHMNVAVACADGDGLNEHDNIFRLIFVSNFSIAKLIRFEVQKKIRTLLQFVKLKIISFNK